jgi:hypothetical protein
VYKALNSILSTRKKIFKELSDHMTHYGYKNHPEIHGLNLKKNLYLEYLCDEYFSSVLRKGKGKQGRGS